MSVLPHVSQLYGDYLSMQQMGSSLGGWYGAEPTGPGWMGRDVEITDAAGLAELLTRQAIEFGAGPQILANVAKLGRGARAVVTGQQVGLLGGPLLTLFKAATAIARASESTRATGVEHVPVFWCATEDHDLAEVDQVALLSKRTVETLRLGLVRTGGEVGGLRLGDEVRGLVEQASELLGYAPVCALLEECYAPERTLGEAFARLITRLFADHGLIVVDAAGREFHARGAATLRAAIEQAEQLEAALLDRSKALEAAGYHAQVLVKPGGSLLFLLDELTGGRVALRRTGPGTWRAGTKNHTTAELLHLLDHAPERLSPNALLRPVFQDTLLPTAAYVGGPAEIAYFAQSAVLYERILGRITPVLPRLSGTVIEPAMAAVMARHEVTLEQIFAAGSAEALAQRLGARAMPIEQKRQLAAAGSAMDAELSALTGYLGAVDESLGRSALISANKMRYQMNRLRRIAARFEVQRDASLGRHAQALMLHLFPGEHPQERVLAGVWFLAQGGERWVDQIVTEAEQMCVGHTVIRLESQAL